MAEISKEGPEERLEEPREPTPEKPAEKPEEELVLERKEEKERGELLAERERVIREELKREIEMMELTPELREEAKKKAKEIESLGEEGKLQRLLDLAQEKGVAFAVGVAKDMKDAATLDTLHDILAKDGFYKRFMR